MRLNILGVSSLLKGKITFASQDYQEVLAKAEKGDVVYMDPPYQGVCGDRDSRYLSGISHAEFVAALEELNRRQIAYLVSYDGRRESKTFGEPLPTSLGLTCIELKAGRSTQATLLGRNEVTYESLYLSQPLTERLGHQPINENCYSRIPNRVSNKIFQSYVLVPGTAEGEVLVLAEPLSLWGGLNPETAEITDRPGFFSSRDFPIVLPAETRKEFRAYSMGISNY